MTRAFTLQHLLNASDHESIGGYQVEGYRYPTTLDATVELEFDFDCLVELDLQQQVELRDDGCVIARDLHGGEVHLRLTVTRPLTPDDLQ